VTSHIIEKESIGARASGKAWAVIVYPPFMQVMEKIPDLSYWLPEGESYSYWTYLWWASYYRMAQMALDIKEKGGVDIEFGEAPWTLVATSEEEEQEMKFFMSFMQESGAHECEWTSIEDLKAIFPSINPKVRGGVTFPQLQVEPYKYTLGLMQAAESMGAETGHGEVVGFGTKGEKITSVKLASGKEIEADAVVIAAGPWSGRLSSLLGTEIPIHPALIECLRLKAPEGFPMHSLGSRDCEILARVNGDIILSGPESGSRDEQFEGAARPDFDATLSPDYVEQTVAAAIELLPDLKDAELIEHRGDLAAYIPGPTYVKPILGRLPDWGNAYFATAGGFGIHLSVGMGEIMADLIVDGQAPYHVKQMMEHIRPGRV
jgi:glycine/D-amino acid oxidase-like deaminating enzyme